MPKPQCPVYKIEGEIYILKKKKKVSLKYLFAMRQIKILQRNGSAKFKKSSYNNNNVEKENRLTEKLWLTILSDFLGKRSNKTLYCVKM